MCNASTAILISSEGVPLSQSEQNDTTESRAYTIKDVLAGEATWADLYDGIDSDTVPDAVGIDTAMARLHTRRLYEEEQSLNEVRFRNVDGSTTIYLFDYPVKYITSRGEVDDISLEIKDTNTANIPYSTASGNAVTTFSRNATDGITLSDNDVSVTLFPIIPEITASATAKIGGDSSSSSLVTRIDNKTVAYNYDNKTTIEYSLTYTGFKEDIVVAEYTGQTEYDFTLETNGLFLTEQKGSFNLCDSKGNIKAALGDIIIFTADEKNNAFGSMTAKTIVEGERYLLTIHVDEDYLSDPNTAYPIRIDPTIEINYESSGSAAIEDVTINTIDTLSGSATTLGVGKYGDDQSISRILMRFPDLDLSAISSATLIQSATVEIRDLMCQHEQLAVYCHAFTGNIWSQSNANWNNVSPNSYGSVSSMNYISYFDGVEQAVSHRYAFDITDIVVGWKLNPSAQSKGIIFKASAEDEADPTHNYKTFASYNRSTNQPSFTLTYSGEDPYEGVLSDNTYYLSNSFTGKYLWNNSSYPHSTSGLISNLGNSIRWQIINTNDGYYIRSAQNTSKYLGVSSNLASVQIYTVSGTAIPDECVWTIGNGRSGGCLISYTNTSSVPLYLKASESGSVLLTSSLGATGSESYKACTWRVADIEYLGTDKRELSSQSYFNDCSITLPNSQFFSLKKYYSNEIWTSNSDFTFAKSGTGGITIDGSYIYANTQGNVTVTATHKVTGRVLYFNVRVNKKAIIILPGIMGSQIFADGNITVQSSWLGDLTNNFGDGTRLWDPSTSEFPLVDEKILALACNSSGEAQYSTKVNPPTINEYDKGNGFQYGATDIYRNVYNLMYENFYTENCDIILYEYDWRIDPYDTSNELSNFIDSSYYGDIVFVSHSMGGLVSSYYLSLGAEQRSLVDKHISVGTPYLGSVEMPYKYLTGKILSNLNDFFIQGSVKDIIYNMPSIYALFPYEQNWVSYLYYGIDSIFVPVETYETTMQLYNQYMPNWNQSLANNAITNISNLFTYDNAHITTLVDSYYIVGTGETTTASIKGELKVNLDQTTQFNNFILESNTQGDGTVTLHSATIGGTLPSSKTYYKTGTATKTADHVGMISGKEDQDLSTLHFIVTIINNTLSDYSIEELNSLYGITQ